MTDQWDFYFTRVDDQPASIYVDLGADQYSPVAHLPYMAYLRLRMKTPRDDGLSSQAEFDQLCVIEDALTAALCGEHTAYVGRNTTMGCRDFFYYLETPDTWAARTEDAMKAFPGYEFRAGVQDDPAWSVYEDFLLPDARTRHTMQNRRVCEQLETEGDPLTAPREIDHWAYFPTQSAATAFVAEMEGAGYQLRAPPSHDAERGDISVQLMRVDLPSFNGIDDVTLAVFDAAERHGGRYDGWETSVER